MAKMGRPAKYNQNKVDRTLQYVETCEVNKVVPYVEELIDILGVDEATIDNWCASYEDFFHIIKRLKRVQKVLLMRYSMTKQAAAGSIFQLKVNHGMIETQRTEIDVNHQLKQLSDEELEAELKKKAKMLGLNKENN